MDYNQPLQINVFDKDWTFIRKHRVDLSESGKRAYWPQGVIQLGDYFLVVYMIRDDNWLGGDQGDIRLGIFSESWKLKQVYEITSFNEDAAMRPWLARSGDQLLITFDAYTKHMLVEVKLDLNAFGVDKDAVDTAVRPQDWDFEEQTVRAQAGCQLTNTPKSLILPFIIGVSALYSRRRFSY